MGTLPTPIVPSLPTRRVPFVGNVLRRTQDIVAAGVWGAQRIEGLDTMLDRNVIAQIVQQVLAQIAADISSEQSINIQLFTASGSSVYTPSPNVVTVMVECVGAGGGGGGATSGIPSPGAAGWLQAGGGGASGGYSRIMLPITSVQNSIPIIIGQGGLGGTPTGMGASGGDTSFGGFCLAKGGGGGHPGFGIGSTSGEADIGEGGSHGQVAPGQAGVGDISFFGNGGEPGSSNFYDPAEQASGQSICFGGRGGPSFFGGSETSLSQAMAGQAGPPGYYGAGGGGAIGGGGGPGPSSGGKGGDGVCIVTEYIASLSITGQGA